MHDPDLLEFLCKKIGSDRVVMGSDYPFPLGEVPMAGKMLASHDQLSDFLNWSERANMLSGNAIELLNLEPRFQTAFRRRLMDFVDSGVQKQSFVEHILEISTQSV